MSYLSELRAVWGHAPLFSVGISVLIQDEQGRLLLQQRGDDGLWGTPGGSLESGEGFLEAARRELWEETGLDCPNLRLMPLEEGLVDGPEFYHRYPNGDEVYMVGWRAHGTLPAAALEAAAPDDSGETLALAWFELEHLPPPSANTNIASINVLRSWVGLPPLPLLPFPTPPTDPGYWPRLRAAVGPRPLMVPGVEVQDAQGCVLVAGQPLHPGESFAGAAARALQEDTGRQAAPLGAINVQIGPQFRQTAEAGQITDPFRVVFRASGYIRQNAYPLHMHADWSTI